MNPLVLIPARMASTRLPGKPLADIAGRPMILHVLDCARAAGIGPVAVAACDEEVAEVVRGAGGMVAMTGPELRSGSDRVHAAARLLDPHGSHDVVVNLQGDLPGLLPADLGRTLRPLEQGGFDIATLVAAINSPEEAAARSVVKVACSFEGKADTAAALYFSRTAIPCGEGPLWHHIGVYAFRREALERFVALPESGLERREKLEQLRALETGMRIGCARIDAAPFGVDTAADLERARSLLAPGPAP